MYGTHATTGTDTLIGPKVRLTVIDKNRGAPCKGRDSHTALPGYNERPNVRGVVRIVEGPAVKSKKGHSALGTHFEMNLSNLLI